MATVNPFEPTAPTEVAPDPVPAPLVRAELWDVLGGVRFVLALTVVSFHVHDLPRQTWLAVALQRLGPLSAVMGFLVISGYSIGHSISRRPRGYLLRRLRRIYPLYALAVLASLVPSAMTGGLTARLAKVTAYNLVFLQTFRTAPVPGNPVVWTLAVEVAFYLLAPVLTRLNTPTLLVLTGVSAVAYAAHPHTGLPPYFQLEHGLPMLFVGWAWLAGFVYHRVQHARAAGPTLLATTATLFDLNTTYNSRLSQATMAACLAVLITGRGWRVPVPVRRLLAFGGDVSYPLYLFHYPVLIAYSVRGGRSQALVLGLSVAVAGLMLAVDVAIRRTTSSLFAPRAAATPSRGPSAPTDAPPAGP